MLRWAPLSVGVIISLTVGGLLLEEWVLAETSDDLDVLLWSFVTAVVAIVAGAVGSAFFFAFILGLALLASYLAEHSG